MSEQGYTLSAKLVRGLIGLLRKDRHGSTGPAAGGGVELPGAMPYRKAWYRIASVVSPPKYTIVRQVWDVTGTRLVDLADVNDPEYNADLEAPWKLDAWDVGLRESYATLRVDDRVRAWPCWVGTAWVYLIAGTPEGRVNPGGVATPYEVLPLIADVNTETAQTDTWDRSNPPDVAGSDPAIKRAGVVWRGTPRVVYKAAGDGKPYVFTRDAVYDSAGGLAYLPAEVRTELDAPIPCVVGG